MLQHPLPPVQRLYPGPFRRLCIALGLLATLTPVPVRAQQRYQLKDDQWQPQVQYDPATPEGQLQEVRQLIAQDRPRKARTLATRWIKAHPDHALLPEAYLLRGDAKAAGVDFYKALFDYEYLAREFPASERFMTALEREYEIAQLFAAGLNRKLWGMPIIPAGGEAEEVFIRIQERAPGSELGQRASLALADYYFNENQMPNAAEAYQLFLTNYPRAEQRQYAMLQLIRASLARFTGPRYDSTGLIDAIQHIRRYQREYPESAEQMGADGLLARIEQSLALKLFYHGQWYEARRETLSAAYLYRRVLEKYATTSAAARALERLNDLNALAQVPVPPPAPLAASPEPSATRQRPADREVQP